MYLSHQSLLIFNHKNQIMLIIIVYTRKKTVIIKYETLITEYTLIVHILIFHIYFHISVIKYDAVYI